MLTFRRIILCIFCLIHFGKLCVPIPVNEREQQIYPSRYTEVTAQEQDFGSNAPHGRGLVLCAGGNDLLVRAIALVSTIRFHLQSKVPIQLFYAGAGEVSPQILHYFRETLQVTTVFGGMVA